MIRDRASGDDGQELAVAGSSVLPPLDDRELSGLRAVGAQWRGSLEDRVSWERALPVDPKLSYESEPGARRGRFVQIRSRRPEHSEDLEAMPWAGAMPASSGRLGFVVRRALVGPVLRSAAVAEERMRKLVALPVLASDALSSVAYGPEAMLAVLVLAGSAELKLSLPIAGAIIVLMIAVGLGYRQVIRAYPHGGGSYIVARENLGSLAGLLAGAGLILDYTLTVTVSIAAGVAAVTSAVPSLATATVPIGIAVIGILVAGNLRGVRSAGSVFAGPTYLFVIAIALIVIVGLFRAATHGFAPTPPAAVHATQGVGILLILRAFSSGATAMTGIEAISNSVPAFQPPEAVNARRTLSVMVVLLIGLFAGTVFLAHLDGAAPGGGQTVLSRLAHQSVGSGILYVYVQAATALVLLLAANTAFNGFPRLLFFMACDSNVPRTFLRMGDRLAFSHGIIALAAAAAAVFAGFGGKTDALIPLYAVGVFLAFTLSQSGMVVHWRRHRERHWRKAALTNAVGALLSAVVLAITAVTKFTHGAWLVLVLIPLIVWVSRKIHAHYQQAHEALIPHAYDRHSGQPLGPRLLAPQPQPARDDHGPEDSNDPRAISNLVVVAVAAIDAASLRALAYAVSLAQPVLAVHISADEQEAARFHRYWEAWGAHLPLEVIVSPYRSTVAPLANYVEALHHQRPEVTLTVVVPEIVVKHRWQRPLHRHIGLHLRRTLRPHAGIAITSIPFHLP
ncbi:MAG: APC family permease [Actinomycetota bacterium]|nr:APC family permease [Actinomycetota bacterium]